MGRQPNRGAAQDRPAFEVVHDNVAYRVAIKRVGSARRFTLRVRAATSDAVLTMPASASLRTARSFAERHAHWIGTRLRTLPGPIPLRAGLVLPVRSVDHTIVHHPIGEGARGRAQIRLPEGCTPEIHVMADEDSVGRLVEALLRREALDDLRTAADRHARAVGRSFSRIVVRDTRSRWGSCSARGTLSFSWRLILAPPLVLDYLVAHEVAHLCHMNHSAAFWAVTERLAPQIEEAEAWLKRNGQALHRYAAV